ncbi:MAG: PASTA domain-containing protein, partial [Planctomycetota bacterium]
MTEPNATTEITSVDNLTVGNVTYDYNDTVAYGLVMSQNPDANTQVPIGSSVDLVVSLGQPTVPNVVGMTEPNATTEITSVDNLTVGSVSYDYNDTIPYGIVISQNPDANTQVPIGSSVDLVVSLGQPTVPDVVGMTEPNATTEITSVDNLTVGSVTYDYNDTVAYGLVISQNPTADTQVPIGSSVDLVVSLGQPTVPDVVGMTEPNATTEITSVDNLTVGNVTYEYNDVIAADIVLSQNPSAGTAVPIGSTVDLVVSLGQPTVPYVVGMTEPNATAEIASVDNLTVGTVTYDYNDTVPADLIANQNPTAGTSVPIGSIVDLIVSLGQPTVPDVVGMTEPNATIEITSVDNLAVGNVTYEYSDIVASELVIIQNPLGGTVVPIGSTVDLIVSLGQPNVPDVVGMTQAAAYEAITAVDSLKVGNVTQQHNDTVPAGLVISQDPAGGSAVPIGSSVDLVVSLGQPTVPYVVGMTEPNATAEIASVDNLTVGNVTYEYNDVIAADIVLSQNPAADTQVLVGSSVDLIVSLGQPTVPNVVGMTEPNATTEITSVDNLTVGNVTYEYNDVIAADIVLSQN